MASLSSPHSGLKSHYDIIIVGSGYGGGVTASRMARAGKKVCVLEKGKEYPVGKFPRTTPESLKETQIDSWKGNAPKQKGLFDVSVNQDINVVRASGLGGTSLINANVGMEPDESVLEDQVWPAAVRADRQVLEECFARAHFMLKTTPYPASLTMPAKAQSMKTAAEKMGLGDKWRFTPIYVNFDVDGPNHVGVEQKPCKCCGDCCSGCNFQAKNTVNMNYLPDAKNHGAEIYTQVQVKYVETNNGKWGVHYLLLDDEGNASEEKILTSDIVVLSGGTLGSTEIMLRSKQKGLNCSPVVGDGFSGNGDFLAFGYNNAYRANSIGTGQRKNPENKKDPVGPNICSIIDLRGKDYTLGPAVIEEGVAPGPTRLAFAGLVSAAAALEGKDTSKTFKSKLAKFWRVVLGLLGPYHGAMNHTMTYLVMTKDDDHGRMRLEDDRLRIHWPGVGTQPVFQKASDKLLELTGHLDGVYTKDPVWTKFFSRQLITVHPLGGCIMGEDSAIAVVNDKGQVFTGTDRSSVHEGLYVSDGSVVPRALCINPSLMITALAERSCILMAKDRGWSFVADRVPPKTV